MERARYAYAAIFVAALLVSLYAMGTAATMRPSIQFQGTAGQGPLVSQYADGYIVANVSIITPFSVDVNGTTINAYITYINYNATGFVLNGSVHALYLNTPFLIRKTGARYFYAELVNVSYYTKTKTVDIYLYSELPPPAASINSRYNLTAGTPRQIRVLGTGAVLTIESSVPAHMSVVAYNVTRSIFVRNGNLTPILILNVSLSTFTNVTASLAIPYPCLESPGAAVPFKLYGSTWKKIPQYSVNVSSCSVLFGIPADPTVGLFLNGSYASQQGSSSTSSIPVIQPSTSVQLSPLPPQTEPSAWEYMAVALIAIAVAAIAYYMLRESGKPARKKQA